MKTKLKKILYGKKRYFECPDCDVLFYQPKNNFENNTVEFKCPECEFKISTHKIQERKHLKFMNIHYSLGMIIFWTYVTVCLLFAEYIDGLSLISAFLKHSTGMGILCIFLGLYFIVQQIYYYHTGFNKNVIKQ